MRFIEFRFGYAAGLRYLRREPRAMSSLKVARTGLPSSPAEAARSIP